MRLTIEQRRLILETVNRVAGKGVDVYLFGSRLDDGAKGGDVDLFLEAERPVSFLQRAQLKWRLEAMLGLPVDLICKTGCNDASPFQAIAKSRAVKLGNC
ncbi:nucleotidyltransferase domain-containing protein [Methylomonas koyamae]|uniref:nucleotidyltransferase domain-containing protein n=1 Tax=Methylomonas koyamae TaxID=702114 RepID=UPI0006D2B5E4|nr:nucleotidyltransferase domain-containing protein [Methylomonas koyamae]BBL57666.1 hypothetical protein MKFW12EY_12790 [Methylomonas koyamae]